MSRTRTHNTRSRKRQKTNPPSGDSNIPGEQPDAIVEEATGIDPGVGVIHPGSTYRGGAQQHGPREAAPHRTTNGTARGRGAPIGFCTKFTEEIGQVHTTKYCNGRGHI